MPISITSNSSAAVAQRNLGIANTEAQRSISKISSGQRVFNAREDAAALSIGTGLRKDVSVFRAAAVNAQSAISLMQIADGALSQMTDILDRMKTLSIQSQSDQLGNVERGFLDVEFQDLKAEMDRIAATTKFNGDVLLGGVNDILLNTVGTSVDAANGYVGYAFEDFVNPAAVFEVSYDTTANMLTIFNVTDSVVQSISVQTPTIGRLTEYNFNQVGVTITINSDFDDTTNLVHVGANEEFSVVIGAVATASTYEFKVGTTTAAEDSIVVNLPLINLTQLGLSLSNVLTIAGGDAANLAIESALNVLSSARSTLGANMNRMEIAAKNIQISMENSEISRSTLLDVDVAAEITNLTAQQVLLEAGTSMLTRANEIPRVLLGLIQGR